MYEDPARILAMVHSRPALPADAATILTYIASRPLDRRLAAIVQTLRARGLEPPLADAALRAKLRALNASRRRRASGHPRRVRPRCVAWPIPAPATSPVGATLLAPRAAIVPEE